MADGIASDAQKGDVDNGEEVGGGETGADVLPDVNFGECEANEDCSQEDVGACEQRASGGGEVCRRDQTYAEAVSYGVCV